jgi:hypothetical protein
VFGGGTWHSLVLLFFAYQFRRTQGENQEAFVIIYLTK